MNLPIQAGDFVIVSEKPKSSIILRKWFNNKTVLMVKKVDHHKCYVTDGNVTGEIAANNTELTLLNIKVGSKVSGSEILQVSPEKGSVRMPNPVTGYSIWWPVSVIPFVERFLNLSEKQPIKQEKDENKMANKLTAGIMIDSTINNIIADESKKNKKEKDKNKMPNKLTVGIMINSTINNIMADESKKNKKEKKQQSEVTYLVTDDKGRPVNKRIYKTAEEANEVAKALASQANRRQNEKRILAGKKKKPPVRFSVSQTTWTTDWDKRVSLAPSFGCLKGAC